jgi:hypothetical protein
MNDAELKKISNSIATKEVIAQIVTVFLVIALIFI